MTLDIAALRAETPGTAHGTHLLACGSALPSRQSLDAVTDHLELEARIGGYEAAAERADQLDGVYDSVARLVGGERQEIALLENATAAWNSAFYSIDFEPGDRVLTCQAEYGANVVAMLHRKRRDGIQIDVAPSMPTGEIDVEALASMITPRTKLIAITWIPTNGGLVNPAAAVGAVAAEHGVRYLLDGCQAVGQMPVDVSALGCDWFSATGRKFLRAPRGTGFLWERSDLVASHHPPMVDHFAASWTAREVFEVRADARRFENWENAYALRAGLGAAVEQALELGLDQIQARAWGLAERLRSGLEAAERAAVTDLGSERCAIVSFTYDGLDPVAAVGQLGAQGISIGSSDSLSSTRLDGEARDLPVLFRAAPHYYNTDDEVDALLDALARLTPAMA